VDTFFSFLSFSAEKPKWLQSKIASPVDYNCRQSEPKNTKNTIDSGIDPK